MKSGKFLVSSAVSISVAAPQLLAACNHNFLGTSK